MPKLQPEDLDKIAEKAKKTMILREGEARVKIIVHMGTCGIAAGARTIVSVLMKKLEEVDSKDILLTTSSCAGLCSREPMMTIDIRGKLPVKYVDLTQEKALRIFSEHIISGDVVREYALAAGSEQTA